ncbi:MAG: hypothetical protein M3513_02945 [Actinomycetota bacterium]|nr:hypothetical protein [Actinomycetota bacterium]
MNVITQEQLADGLSRRRFLAATGNVASLAALAQVPLAKGASASPMPVSGTTRSASGLR